MFSIPFPVQFCKVLKVIFKNRTFLQDLSVGNTKPCIFPGPLPRRIFYIMILQTNMLSSIIFVSACLTAIHFPCQTKFNAYSFRPIRFDTISYKWQRKCKSKKNQGLVLFSLELYEIYLPAMIANCIELQNTKYLTSYIILHFRPNHAKHSHSQNGLKHLFSVA